MTGQHAPSSGARRAWGPEPTRGRRPAVRSVLRVVLWLAALAAVAFTVVVVYGFIRLDHDIDHPQDGFSGWQCASRSGTCDREHN